MGKPLIFRNSSAVWRAPAGNNAHTLEATWAEITPTSTSVTHLHTSKHCHEKEVTWNRHLRSEWKKKANKWLQISGLKHTETHIIHYNKDRLQKVSSKNANWGGNWVKCDSPTPVKCNWTQQVHLTNTANRMQPGRRTAARESPQHSEQEFLLLFCTKLILSQQL